MLLFININDILLLLLLLLLIKMLYSKFSSNKTKFVKMFND